MTAIKSRVHMQQLASQRLPVPSVEVEKLLKENMRLRNALEPFADRALWLKEYLSDWDGHCIPVDASHLMAALAALSEQGEGE